ncbi:MAG: hypothetical protein IJ527_07635 [Prevotella sp.]|nr:hypothetical protein [Prevotella sp.]
MTDMQETNRTNVLFERIAALIEQSRQFDTLKRCRYFYQAYESAVIGATPLPQLGKEEKNPANEEVAHCGNGVATIRLPRFTLSWSHYLILMRIENVELKEWIAKFNKMNHSAELGFEVHEAMQKTNESINN